MIVPKAKRVSSGAWYIYMRLGGRQISVTAPTERECIREAQRIKAEYLAGRDTGPTGLTIGKAVDRYIRDRSAVLSPSTLFGYGKIAARFEHIRDISPDRVQWQREVNAAAQKYGAKTVKNSFGFLGSALKYSGYQLPALRYPQIVHAEHPWLTPEQMPVFLGAVRGDPCEIGALLALHGLRRSELIALDKDSVTGGVIHVRGSIVRGEDGMTRKQTNKNAASRRDVPVMLPRLSDLVDAAPPGPLIRHDPNTLYKRVNLICEREGLPLVGVHGLRHSFASLCYHVGLSERQTMALGGWSDPGTMRRIYTHLSESDRLTGAAKIADFFAKTQTKNANQT